MWCVGVFGVVGVVGVVGVLCGLVLLVLLVCMVRNILSAQCFDCPVAVVKSTRVMLADDVDDDEAAVEWKRYYRNAKLDERNL